MKSGTRRGFATWRVLAAGPVIALVLLACQSAPPARPEEVAAPPAASAAPVGEGFAALAQGGGGTVMRIDPAKSTVRIYVFRGGAAARLGHDHVFAAPDFEALAFVPSGDPSTARFDVRVPLAALTLDDPAWRAQTGDSFSGERSASDIEGTRRNMLGPKGLDAAQFPDVRLTSTAVHGDWPILVADTAVTLHGVTRVQPVMLEVHRTPDALRVSGSLVLRQSEFGATPFSVLNGLMAVQDEVALRFELVGSPVAVP